MRGVRGWHGGWGFLIVLCLVSPAFAAINAYEFDDPVDERRFRELIAELRCPKCQNQNIADSNAPLSQDLRQRVYQMLQEGVSNEEIKLFMRDRYGDFITYRPPVKPMTWPLWFGPIGLVLVVGAGLFVWSRRSQNRTQPELSPRERERLQALLADKDRD